MTKKILYLATLFALLAACSPKVIRRDAKSKDRDDLIPATATSGESVEYISYVKYSLDTAFPIPDTREGVFLVFDDRWADTLQEYLVSAQAVPELRGAFRAKGNGFYRVIAQIGLPPPARGWSDGDFCEIFISKSDGSLWGNNRTSMHQGDTGPCIVQAVTVIGLIAGQSFKVGARAVPANTTYPMKKSYLTTLTVVKEVGPDEKKATSLQFAELPLQPPPLPRYAMPVPLPGGQVWNFQLEHPCGSDAVANFSNLACDRAYPRTPSSPGGPPECAPLQSICEPFGQRPLYEPAQREGRNAWVQKCFSNNRSVIGALQQALQTRSSTNTACPEYVTLGRVHDGVAQYWDAPVDADADCDQIPLDVTVIYGCTVERR